MSNETKWTPGPWRQSTGVGYCAIRTDEGVIADMRFVDRYYNPFDACLIAAAPCLYEALEALLEKCHAEPHGEHERRAAITALAKARGES